MNGYEKIPGLKKTRDSYCCEISIQRLFCCSFCCCLFCLSLYGSLFCLLGSRTTATTCLLLSLRSLSHVLIEVNELDESDRSSVTLTGTQLDDASVATGTVAYLLSNDIEKFLDSFLVLEITENNTTVVGITYLRTSDQWLNEFLESLSLSEGRSDSFVQNQAGSHVGQHATAVTCSTAQMIEFLVMSHFCFVL